MKSHFLLKAIAMVFIFNALSCNVKPEPIDYGKDQCSYCVMNIVDKTHAAQYVTKKGKQFKFDAIECMVNDINEKNEEDIAIMLVADYQNPGFMINADKATFIISKEIKSPMGANLSALNSYEKAVELQKIHSGDIFDWKKLKIRLSDK